LLTFLSFAHCGLLALANPRAFSESSAAWLAFDDLTERKEYHESTH